MNKKVAESLINARKAVRRKFEQLQENIATGETFLQKKFKPIADPLKELLENIKKEPGIIKSEPPVVKFETVKPTGSQPTGSQPTGSPVAFSTPTIAASKVRHDDTRIPKQRLSVLRTQTVAESLPDTSAESSVQREASIDDDDEILNVDSQAVWDEIAKHPAVQEYLSQFGGTAAIYMAGWTIDKKKEYDYVYGPHREIREKDGKEYDTGNLLLGNSILDFSDDGKVIYITTPDKVRHPYEGSVALYELIFKNKPSRAVIENNVKAARSYKDILLRTNAHRQDADPNKQVKGSKGRKYIEFVKPIINMSFTKEGIAESALFKHKRIAPPRPRASTISVMKTGKKKGDDTDKNKGDGTGSKKGGGIIQYNNRKVEYVPYKDPNSLINRLKILISSQLAGNNAHTNEIAYIIEELQRTRIIK